MDFFKKVTEKVTVAASTVGDMTKIFADIQKEKKKIKESEEKIKSIYEELGKMIVNDRDKETITIDVNYRTKINIIMSEQQKISDTKKKIEEINSTINK